MPRVTAEHLPALPSDITAEWLGSKLGHKIKSITNTRNIWGTGSKLFYTIAYDENENENDNDDDKSSSDDDERPTHICIKGVFQPDMMQAQPWTVSLAQREAEFFSLIAPRVTGTILYPKGWWSGTSEKQGIAIMNDLVEEGCTFPGEAASYPVDKVMDGVEQLAGLHAQFWGQRQENYPWIWNNYDPAMTFMCRPWDEIVRSPDRPPLPDYLLDGKRCNEALDRYYAERNPRFRTLLHGDTHIGNIYFPARDGRSNRSSSRSGSSSSIGFLDWSAFHFGSCFHDIVYLMTAMLSIEDRRAHEMEILDHYLDTLHRRGGPRFDRHEDPEVMIEYRRSFMTNVIWLICPYELQTKERVAALCERTVAAYDDHGVIDVILDRPRPAAVAGERGAK